MQANSGETRDMPVIDMDQLRNYSEMKSKTILQVMPVKGNEERLADLPYQQMEDMAVVCRAMLGGNAEGEMSFLVTNPLMKEYGISREELFADAAGNMDYSIRPIFSVLSELEPGLADETIAPPDDMLFVVTNEQKVYGAGAIADPAFAEKADKLMKGDFFILPSSIHEVLLLRDDGNTDYRALEAMVREINITQVAPEERLSDQVYHFDASEKLLETGKHFSDRQSQKEMGRNSVLKDLAENKKQVENYQPKVGSSAERGGPVL